MTLRNATPADIGFIRSLTTRPDYAPFIGDSDEATLQGWIDSPEARVMIWDEGKGPAGFAIFREIGDPSGRVELFRIALAQAGGANARGRHARDGAAREPAGARRVSAVHGPPAAAAWPARCGDGRA